jgi:hypothetical protein
MMRMNSCRHETSLSFSTFFFLLFPFIRKIMYFLLAPSRLSSHNHQFAHPLTHPNSHRTPTTRPHSRAKPQRAPLSRRVASPKS